MRTSKQNHQVHIIATDKAPKDCIGKLFINKDNVASQIFDLDEILKANQWFGAKPFEIYLTSRLEIKEGDLVKDKWFISSECGLVQGVKIKDRYFHNTAEGNNYLYKHKEVIASTDKIITPESWIPDSFVSAYVNTHNSRVEENIVDVDLEVGYEYNGERIGITDISHLTDERDISMHDKYIKTRSDYSVIIHQSKRITISQALELYELGREDRADSRINGEYINNSDKWIEENITNKKDN